MKYTKHQEKVMRQLKMSKIYWKKMWKTSHQLGYSSKEKLRYAISVASDYPNEDVKKVVLIHELGHQIYGHLDQVDLKQEMKDIKEMLSKKGLPFSALRYYGGPHCFINIAMDLYINSTLLTKDNCSLMYGEGLNICTPSHYGFEWQDDFRKYYSLLIEKMMENINNKKKEESEEDNNNQYGESGESNDDSQNNPNPDKASDDFEEDENDEEDEDSDDFDEDEEDDYDDDLEDFGEDSDDEFEYSDEDFEDSDEKLNDNQKDLPETVSSFDEDIDEEIADEIRYENYNSGTEKSKYFSNSPSETVGEFVTKEAEEELREGTQFSGNGLSTTRYTRNIENFESDKKIKKFLSSIVETSMEFEHDALRHHNHGTRQNKSGILYSSMKRKHNINKNKLGILVDCSGSMDSTSLIRAIGSLKESLNLISEDSTVVAWDSGFCDEWNIKKLPNHIVEGGCTDMASGVKYLINKNCDDIVVYSDMGTDMCDMNNVLDTYKGNIYTIIVSNGYDLKYLESAEFNKYLKRNKNYITI